MGLIYNNIDNLSSHTQNIFLSMNLLDNNYKNFSSYLDNPIIVNLILFDFFDKLNFFTLSNEDFKKEINVFFNMKKNNTRYNTEKDLQNEILKNKVFEEYNKYKLNKNNVFNDKNLEKLNIKKVENIWDLIANLSTKQKKEIGLQNIFFNHFKNVTFYLIRNLENKDFEIENEILDYLHNFYKNKSTNFFTPIYVCFLLNFLIGYDVYKNNLNIEKSLSYKLIKTLKFELNFSLGEIQKTKLLDFLYEKILFPNLILDINDVNKEEINFSKNLNILVKNIVQNIYFPWNKDSVYQIKNNKKFYFKNIDNHNYLNKKYNLNNVRYSLQKEKIDKNKSIVRNFLLDEQKEQQHTEDVFINFLSNAYINGKIINELNDYYAINLKNLTFSELNEVCNRQGNNINNLLKKIDKETQQTSLTYLYKFKIDEALFEQILSNYFELFNKINKEFKNDYRIIDITKNSLLNISKEVLKKDTQTNILFLNYLLNDKNIYWKNVDNKYFKDFFNDILDITKNENIISENNKKIIEKKYLENLLQTKYIINKRNKI